MGGRIYGLDDARRKEVIALQGVATVLVSHSPFPIPLPCGVLHIDLKIGLFNGAAHAFQIGPVFQGEAEDLIQNRKWHLLSLLIDHHMFGLNGCSHEDVQSILGQSVLGFQLPLLSCVDGYLGEQVFGIERRNFAFPHPHLIKFEKLIHLLAVTLQKGNPSLKSQQLQIDKTNLGGQSSQMMFRFRAACSNSA